jgi:DNA ligase (NAD+)
MSTTDTDADADADADVDLPEELADNPYVLDPPTEFGPVDDIDAETAAEQAAALRAAIRYHDRRYYVDSDPVVADRTYDALFERLAALEAAFDLETEDSPTRRVGGEPVDEFPTVSHVAPMLSVDSGDSPADVREFDDRVRRELARDREDEADDLGLAYVCEPKFDGVSIEVVYEDGRLVRAVTRGNGREGDDVTSNVRTVRSVPQRLRNGPDFLAVRGEIHMPRSAFTAYNRERVERGEEPFANPRNATAGTLRQQDPAVVAERPLQVFFFDVLDSSAPWDTRFEEHQAFSDLGLRVNDRVERVEDVEAAIDYRDRLLADREDLDYEIDGVVIKVDDRDRRERLGTTSRHYRWAYAYKFPARNEETRVADVAVQVGRTGRLTPVAMLDPVDVGGVTVSRASLHNPDEIERLGVNVGDQVRVERAGDVIPQVAEVVEKNSAGTYDLPDRCPVCDSPVERDGPIAYCSGGLGCRAQLLRAVEHYASDTGLDIEGLGERTVERLYEEGLIEEDLADLYDLTVCDLADLEGFGERSARNLVEAVDASREPSLPAFLSAIGVPEVGPATARNLAREFGDLESLMTADREALQSVPDVGPTVAGVVADFFESKANRRVLDRLRDRGVDPQPVEVETGADEGALDGSTFVFTGSLSELTRKEAEALVERHGASATGSVSGNTDYLVVGDGAGQRKREDAAQNDVPELDEAEFRDLLADHGVDVDDDEGEEGDGDPRQATLDGVSNGDDDER